MNYRAVTILVILCSIAYAVVIFTLIFALKKGNLNDYPEGSGNKEVKNFLIVSQVLRVITSFLLLKVISPAPEESRMNRNLILPYITWNTIAAFISAVVIIHFVLNPRQHSTAKGFVALLGVGTCMLVFFVILMCMRYRHLLLPLRSRGPSTVAILSSQNNSISRERTKSFLTEKEDL